MADTDRISQHRHCFVCGKAHTDDGRFCGESCKESKRTELSKKKRQLLFIEVLLIALTIGAILAIM
jgi:predicted nucleic acid-binding Zn ribbon protein